MQGKTRSRCGMHASEIATLVVLFAATALATFALLVLRNKTRRSHHSTSSSSSAARLIQVGAGQVPDAVFATGSDGVDAALVADYDFDEVSLGEALDGDDDGFAPAVREPDALTYTVECGGGGGGCSRVHGGVRAPPDHAQPTGARAPMASLLHGDANVLDAAVSRVPHRPTSPPPLPFPPAQPRARRSRSSALEGARFSPPNSPAHM